MEYQELWETDEKPNDIPLEEWLWITNQHRRTIQEELE